MQMREILHPGVIKTSVMCVVESWKSAAQHRSLPYVNVIIVRLDGGEGARGGEAVPTLDGRQIGLAGESVVQHWALIARKMYMAFNNQIYLSTKQL